MVLVPSVLENSVPHEKEKKSVSCVLCTKYVRTEYTRQAATFLACQLLLQSDNCEMMSFLLVAISSSGWKWLVLSFGCVGCCAAAVVGQGSCRLTAFEPFNRRIFVVILYWIVSQHLPLNPIRTLLYKCIVIKTGSRNFLKPYSLKRRKFYRCSSSSFLVEPGTFEESHLYTICFLLLL